MATIVTRAGKGSPLTNTEVDANFTNLNTDKAELSGATFTGEIVANAGIDVTGTATMDGLVVDGNTQFNSASAAASGTRSIQFYRDSAERGAVRFDYSASTMELQADGNFFVSTGGESTRLFVNNNGDISFYEDTGTTAKLFWDASAESLGIGTSSPSQLIHGKTDSGNAYMRIERASQSAGQVGFQIGGGTSSTDWFTYIPSGSDDLAFFGNSAERMRITSAGNVGIGTPTPATLVDLAAENPVLTLRDSRGSGSWTAGTELGKIDFRTSDGTGIGAHSIASIGVVAGGSNTASPDGELVFATGSYNAVSQERLRIDSAGRVGIGTDSPLQALHVNSGTGNSAAIFESTDSTSQIWLKDSASSTTYQTGLGCLGDNLLFNNGGERMRITSTGNVGIGTSSVIGNLNLHGGTGDTASQDVVQAFTRISSTGNKLAAKIRLDNYDSNHADLKFQVKTTASSAESDSYYTDALTIQGTSGNVGIGESDPQKNLHLSGLDSQYMLFRTKTATVTAGTVSGGLLFMNGDDSTPAGDRVSAAIKAVAADGFGRQDLVFSTSLTNPKTVYGGAADYTDATIERMRVDYLGSVGIGTSSPSSFYSGARQLVVGDGSGENGITMYAGSESASYLLFADGTSGDSLYSGQIRYNHSDNSLQFATNGNTAERMRIDSAGNVGIGVTPSAWASSFTALQVENASLWSTGSDASLTANAYYAGSNYKYIASSAASRQYHNTDGSIAWAQAPSGTAGNNITFAERMRIDSSGNLLVGTTDTFVADNTSGNGLSYRASAGDLGVAATNTPAFYANRMSSDGDIAVFRKDGTSVGSIGTNGGDLYIGTGDTALRFFDGSDFIYPVSTATGTARDNAIDLGYSTGRFKDLYLSGGVYLGGTGAANKLEDYEEGTWTPAFEKSGSSPTVSYQYQTGTYTKIGNLVFAFFDMNATSISGGSGTPKITGLPFTVSPNQAGYSAINFRDSAAFVGIANTVLRGYAEKNNSHIVPQIDNSGSAGYGFNSNPNYNSSGRATGYIVYQAS